MFESFQLKKEKTDPELVPETLHVEANIGDSDDDEMETRHGSDPKESWVSQAVREG